MTILQNRLNLRIGGVAYCLLWELHQKGLHLQPAQETGLICQKKEKYYIILINLDN